MLQIYVRILALVIRHASASFLRRVVLSPVACPAPPHFFTLSHKSCVKHFSL